MPRGKYPIREWLGKYEAMISWAKPRNEAIHISYLINPFFDKFNRAKSIEDYTITDVGDYIELRKSEAYSNHSVKNEIRALEVMWEWMILNSVKITNIFTPWRHKLHLRIGSGRPRKTNSPVHLEDWTRLIEASTPMLREYLIALASDTRIHRRPIKVDKLLRVAANEAGLPNITLSRLRSYLKGRLGREMMCAYCQRWLKENPHIKVTNSLVHKPESGRDQFTTINVPSTDIGSSIIDDHDYYLVIAGVC